VTVDRKRFFAAMRSGRLLGPVLDQSEVDGCDAILDAMDGAPVNWTAYALATAYLETAHTMRPIKEIGGGKYYFRMYDLGGNRPEVARELGNIHPGDGAKYPGRGYVQLTGRGNYERAAIKLRIDLAGSPERALEPQVAADVMRLGMTEGWFTGKGFADFLPPDAAVTLTDFTRARRIINRQDRAAEIARYAATFLAALS